jgi:cytochrome c-type biogenesis protein CcmE
MNPKRKQKLILILAMVAGVGVAVGLLLNAFQANLMLFFSPTDVVAGKAPDDAKFRIGGLVEAGSVAREADGLTVSFKVTDNAETVPIRYTGILPDLFREGQGIVSLGRLGEDGVFVASEVLAKHDENYMPPEVAEALEKTRKQAGEQGGATPAVHGAGTVQMQ